MKLLNGPPMAETKEIEGVIFKIKRFSVHDGPGIRTTVFLKGCPLNCIWCHSPEGIDRKITIWHNPNICIGCGKCTVSCPENALTLIKDKKAFIEIDRIRCNVTGNCVEACPAGAIQFTGTVSFVSEIVSEIEKDKIYYDSSGGGVTLSGGEPLYQADFSAAILKACKINNINTAIETSLFCEPDVLEYIEDYVDLFIIDLKIFDTTDHKKYTGKTNNKVLDNFLHLAGKGKNILVRIPMVGNITDTKKNLQEITRFVKSVRDDIEIERVSFNLLTENNYKKLGIPFPLNKNI
jgi:pyruvate formate lyase activating enzyme